MAVAFYLSLFNEQNVNLFTTELSLAKNLKAYSYAWNFGFSLLIIQVVCFILIVEVNYVALCI